MSSLAHSKLKKDVRSMPNWVNENNQRIGPKPPTPPINNGVYNVPALPPKNKANEVEPDYEVIEFSGQQYSNESMMSNVVMRTKTPDSKLKCTLCGSNNPWVTCGECAQQIFCASCDDMYHKHPKRKNHVRKAIEQNTRPPLPPKILPGQPGPTPPVAPPRRSKRGIITPLMQRKDQVHMNSQLQAPASPTPSLKSNSLQDRTGSLQRGMSLMNRPLPAPPKAPTTPESDISRSTTPRSAFDAIQRPPSVTLEKIKNKANATLDRMAILQQRYRQQKEEQQQNRSDSVSSQNLSFDQWTNISPSPSNFRSGSMSSGLNCSHLDLLDDLHFNFNHQRQQQQQMNRPRNMSSSVFNLSQLNRPAPHAAQTANTWGTNPLMQQAQSMAQLNCMGCNPAPQWAPQHSHHMGYRKHMDDFSSQQQLNRSNLSLNMPAGAGYMLPGHQPYHHGYPPPVFMNQRGGMMYPYPYNSGMPLMHPGVMGVPPTARSRVTSRAGSRATSPAMSRKSMTMRRKRNNSFAADDDATDDEDSDLDDRRSLVSNRSYLTSASRSGQRPRRMSNVSQPGAFEDTESETKHNRRSRLSERRNSTAKSVQSDWVTTRRETGTLKPNKIYSDLDSEGSGTRALVQAKIQEKLDQTAKKVKSRKRSSGSESVDEKPKPLKVSTEVQAGSVRSKTDTVFQNTSTATSNEKVQTECEENSAEDEGESQVEEEKEEEAEMRPTEAKVINQECVASNAEDPSESQRAAKTEVNGAEAGDELGPPPSTPDYEWECEFCTFVNAPNIKICTICCKTPSTLPKRHTEPAPTPLKAEKTPPKQKTASVQNIETPLSPTKHKTIPKSNKVEKPIQTVTNSVSKLKVTPSENESDQCNNNSQSCSSGSGNNLYPSQKKLAKDTVEDIWTALDENIQATADEVIRKSKVSTGCGTSPPPIGSTKITSEQTYDVERFDREIGTSPPPQSISTQTYDVLPFKSNEPPIEKETLSNGPARLLSNVQNVENHTQSYNNTNGKISPFDLKSPQWTILDNLSHQNERVSEFSRDKEDRYRSISDLRYRDVDSPYLFHGLGRRQSSYAELLSLQRTQSQMQNNGSSYNFDMTRYEPKPGRDPETELFILLKEAEMYKFTPEELQAALKNCGPDMHPIQWLRDNWPKLIQTVRSLATKYGQERIENTIGTISQQEAREALRMHGGNIWQAVSECIEQRQRKYRDISSKGNFSREDIVTALTMHQGNVELALMDLGRTQLKPFLMRIWGSPGGVENESGSNAFFQSPQSPLSEASFNTSHDQAIKNDIHEFLSANASECLQTPSISGASMQDFHSPNQRHDLDNATANIEAIHSYPNINSNFQEQADDTYSYNKHTLKDLETLIGNIEQNQAKQNKEVLQSIEGMLEQLINKREVDQDMDPETKRILMKSPINTPKVKSTPNDNVTLDIKAFVWQNIQEIVPSLVQQVKAELGETEIIESAVDTHLSGAEETTTSQSNNFIVEEIIQPNIKEASIREELPPDFVYAAEIANFRLEFDRALEREHESEYEFDSTENASHSVYKMFTASTELSATHESSKEETELAEEEYFETLEPTAFAFISQENEQHLSDVAPTQEEQPSTSRKALRNKEKDVKSAKSVKKTGIPKLQETNQLDLFKTVEVERPKGKSPLRIASNAEKSKQPQQPNPEKSKTAHVVTLKAEVTKENIIQEKINWAEKSQPKKRIITSKIPIRRDSRVSNPKPVEVLEPAESATASRNVFDETSNVSEEPLSKVETREYEQDQKLHSQVESSVEAVEMHNLQIDEVFKDLEELSSDEDDSEFPDNPIPKIGPEKIDDITSGEEELFSAGSGSAHSSQHRLENYIKNWSNTQKAATKDTALNREQSSFIFEDKSEAPESHDLILSDFQNIVVQKKISQAIRTTDEVSVVPENYEANKTEAQVSYDSESNRIKGESFQGLVASENGVYEIDDEVPTDSENNVLEEAKYQAVSDQSKKNLSKLVSDTQLLIKQMKDEITLDEFESSDEEVYSEDFSVEYDDTDDEEGDWGEEEGEDEEDDLDYENDEELASIFEENGSAIESEELNTDEEEQLLLKDNKASPNYTTLPIEMLISTPDTAITTSLAIDDINKVVQSNEMTISATPTEAETTNNNAEIETFNAENAIPEPLVEVLLENVRDRSVKVLEASEVEASHALNREVPAFEPFLPRNYENNVPETAITTSLAIDDINNLVQSNEMTMSATPTEAETTNNNAEIETFNAENAIPEPLIEVLLENVRDRSVKVLEASEFEASHALDREMPVFEPILPRNYENNVPFNAVSRFTSTKQSENTKGDLSSVHPVNNAIHVSNLEIDQSPNDSNALDIVLPTIAISTRISANTNENVENQDNTSIETDLNYVDKTSTDSQEVTITRMATDNAKTDVLQLDMDTNLSVITYDDVSSPQQAAPIAETAINTSNNLKELTKATETLNGNQPTKRISSKIPKPKENASKHVSKKMPLRSKSFSGPPTPMGISSVKAIQQQYLKKQSLLSPNFSQPKIVHPPVVRKKSITEAINKLTQPTKENLSTTMNDGPSTSSSIFRTRTHMRIPKKKYHETCFSDDDYGTTSSEEEPELLDVLQRKRSVPVFRAYPSIQEPEEVNSEELARKLVEENLVGNIAEAQIAATLVSMKFQQDVSIWAAKECSDLEQAIALLQQECELCMSTHPLNQVVSMLKCTHKCCKQCAKSYFTVQITDRSINDCNCPFCKIPELHDQSADHEDENLEYFSNLDIFLKNILDPEVHELFQRKLRDLSLLQDPNFKWCVQCSSGFFARPKQKRLTCPDCGSVTCSQCRKKWEKQHEGISCDQFQAWKEANDPEIQAQGVQEHLAHNGIDCPKCKFRYSLARGGCMHFTCTQCKFEFCYGCSRPFMMGAKCHVSSYCAKLGLHAHHPRNCLFYLRDKIPLQLQFLLKENGVSFDVDPIDKGNTQLCPIPIQKETPTGLFDTVCNGEVPDKHAGMCRTHYVEYLTAIVAKSGIDPLPIFDLTDCVQELRRRGIALPERGPWDTDEIYKNMCSEVIRQRIPLESN